MIVIRLLKVLTRVEYEQAKTVEGRRSIKATRDRLIYDLRPSWADLIKKSTGTSVIGLHSDLSTRTGERIIILVLDRKVSEIPEGSNGTA